MSDNQNPPITKPTGSLSPPKPVTGAENRPPPPTGSLLQKTGQTGQIPAVQQPAMTVRDERDAEYRTTHDSALLEGWRRYKAYSEASKRQKGLYTSLRSWIIRLSFAASVIAALATLPMVFGDEVLAGIFRIALIAMPITVAGAMTYATEFTPNSAWIIYRVAAQQILHEIYRYRMESGVYSDSTLTGGARQELFLQRITKQVNDVTRTLTSEETATVEPVLLQYEDEQAIAEYAKTKRAGDGFSAMSSDDYINTRVISQRNWYIKKLREDYQKLRKTRFAILIFAGIGAVIAGVDIQWAFVVVITTAMVTAITTWMQLEMQGQTYGHYNLTANTLDEMLSEWYILSDEQRMRPEILAKLVNDVEGVLENEELAWMQQAIQSQMLAQQSMERSLTSLSGTSRYDDSENSGEWARIRASLDDSYYALSTAGAAQSVIPPGMDDDTDKSSVG